MGQPLFHPKYKRTHLLPSKITRNHPPLFIPPKSPPPLPCPLKTRIPSSDINLNAPLTDTKPTQAKSFTLLLTIHFSNSWSPIPPAPFEDAGTAPNSCNTTCSLKTSSVSTNLTAELPLLT